MTPEEFESELNRAFLAGWRAAVECAHRRGEVDLAWGDAEWERWRWSLIEDQRAQQAEP